MAFADLADAATLAEDYLKFAFVEVLGKCSEDMAFFDLRIEPGLLDTLSSIIDAQFVKQIFIFRIC